MLLFGLVMFSCSPKEDTVWVVEVVTQNKSKTIVRPDMLLFGLVMFSCSPKEDTVWVVEVVTQNKIKTSKKQSKNFFDHNLSIKIAEIFRPYATQEQTLFFIGCPYWLSALLYKNSYLYFEAANSCQKRTKQTDRDFHCR